MALDIYYARISESQTGAYNHLYVDEESQEVVDLFRKYIRKHRFPGDDQEDEVLFYQILYHQMGNSIVFSSFYEQIGADTIFLTKLGMQKILLYLKPELVTEYQRLVIDKFVEGLDMVIVSY